MYKYGLPCAHNLTHVYTIERRVTFHNHDVPQDCVNVHTATTLHKAVTWCLGQEPVDWSPDNEFGISDDEILDFYLSIHYWNFVICREPLDGNIVGSEVVAAVYPMAQNGKWEVDYSGATVKLN